MGNTEDALRAIRALHRKADEFFRVAVQASPGSFKCGPGCHGCCHLDLSVFPVEAATVEEAVASLGESEKSKVLHNLENRSYCVFLDQGQGTCLIYDARPLICRTHGMAVLMDGELSHCPLNYPGERPSRSHILDLSKLNAALASIVARDGRSRRVKLSTVARRALAPRRNSNRKRAWRTR